jgi:hypothetical protein
MAAIALALLGFALMINGSSACIYIYGNRDEAAVSCTLAVL